MAKHDDGGPAYPASLEEWQSGWGGMTLLDYFAGQALCHLVDEFKLTEDLATRCYGIAEYMIAEKRRRETADEPEQVPDARLCRKAD